MVLRPDDGTGPKSAPAGIDLLEVPLDQLLRIVNRALLRSGVFDPDQPRPRIGSFEVRGICGDGGYGSVLRCWDPVLDREVAVKLCANDRPATTAVLLSEARTLAKLSNPNIVTIYECDTYGDKLCLVMEYIDGGTLHHCAVDHRVESRRVLVEIFADIARGLAAAHRAGVIHGDIKPENILLDGDLRPRIVDFGLARTIGSPTLMPRAIGTLPYAAPELLAGEVRDQRSDQWSFFVSLWHCLDGKLPTLDTDGRLPSSDEEMREAIESWPGVSTLRREVPEALREILRVGLALDPRDRFASMDAVAEALDAVLVGGTVERPAVKPERAKRGWMSAGSWALLVAVGLGLTVGAYALGQRAAFRAETSTTGTVEAQPSRCDEARAAFDAAFVAAESGSLQRSFGIWMPAHFTLRDCDLEVDGERSLELANKMEAHMKDQDLPAWVAAGAAESFEKAENWERAIVARERAVELYEAAHAPEGAAEQLECLSYNNAHQKCPKMRESP